MGNLGDAHREMTQVKQAMAKVFQNPGEHVSQDCSSKE